MFRTDFNLGFRKPKSDPCSRCDALQIAIKEEPDCEEKVKIEKERDDHQSSLSWTWATCMPNFVAIDKILPELLAV